MKEREYCFDFVKVAATVLILLHHYQQITGIRFDKGINFYGGEFYFGYVVELFFLLSGYFMYRYISIILDGKISFFQYIKIRYIRFLPMLIICTMVFAVLSKIYQMLNGHPFMNREITLWGMIVTSLGVQEGWVFANPGLNNPTWYISVLLLCYVMFYICVYISRSFKVNVNYLFLFFILVGIGFCNYEVKWLFASPMLGRGYYSFFFGVTMHELMVRFPLKRTYTVAAMIISLLFIWLMITHPYFIKYGEGYLLTFIFYPSILIIVKSNVLGPVVNRKMWEVLGNISFDVYMWHINCLIIFCIIGCISDNIRFSDPVFMLVFVVVCFFTGTISYFLIEKPIEKYTKRHTFIDGQKGMF